MTLKEAVSKEVDEGGGGGGVVYRYDEIITECRNVRPVPC
jgi:hypothetical protein